jgi:hypothetical protein
MGGCCCSTLLLLPVKNEGGSNCEAALGAAVEVDTVAGTPKTNHDSDVIGS